MNVHDSRAARRPARGRRLRPRRPTDETPDVVVFNTCAVRENADNRLYGNLGHLRPVKAAHPGMQIAVGGCLAQKDRSDDRPTGRPGSTSSSARTTSAALPTLLERARHNDEAQVEILEALEVFPSTLPTRRESAYAAWVSDQRRLQQHLHLLHRPDACAARSGTAGRATSWPRSRRWSPTASSRSPCSGRTSTPTASSSATGARSASCCAPAVRSPGLERVRFTSRTRGTSPTT